MSFLSQLFIVLSVINLYHVAGETAFECPIAIKGCKCEKYSSFFNSFKAKCEKGRVILGDVIYNSNVADSIRFLSIGSEPLTGQYLSQFPHIEELYLDNNYIGNAPVSLLESKYE